MSSILPQNSCSLQFSALIDETKFKSVRKRNSAPRKTQIEVVNSRLIQNRAHGIKLSKFIFGSSEVKMSFVSPVCTVHGKKTPKLSKMHSLVSCAQF